MKKAKIEKTLEWRDRRDEEGNLIRYTVTVYEVRIRFDKQIDAILFSRKAEKLVK